MRFQCNLLGALAAALTLAGSAASAADIGRSFGEVAPGRYAVVKPGCFEGRKPAPHVLFCPPQVILPITPETYHLSETYLEIGRTQRPYRQLFTW